MYFSHGHFNGIMEGVACKSLKVTVQSAGPVCKPQENYCYGTALRIADWMGSQQVWHQQSQLYRSAPFILSPAKMCIKPLQLFCIPANTCASAILSGYVLHYLFWTNIHLLYRNRNSFVFFQLKKDMLFGAEGSILSDFPSCPLDYPLSFLRECPWSDGTFQSVVTRQVQRETGEAQL